ncbi:MAG: HEAT repeat domain-containing protein [Deltaproteobacteria bacterium]|nr:HEAT repeat domain-containing protein [Deltaproteobacteria bacterium]
MRGRQFPPWVALIVIACPAKKTPQNVIEADASANSTDVDAVVARLSQTLAPSERRSLLRRLATLDRARAVPLLRRAVGDESPEVRLGVARLIGQMRVNEAAADLAARLRVETIPIVNAEIGTALALLRDRAVATGLVDLVDVGDADRRTAAARVVGVTLGSGAVSDSTIEQLTVALVSAEPATRRDAARVLKELRDVRARVPLERRLLSETDEMTIAVILNALAAIGDRGAVFPITKFVGSLRTRGAIPPVHFVWQRAFAALMALGGDDADRFLREASRWPEVRMTKELAEKLRPWTNRR